MNIEFEHRRVELGIAWRSAGASTPISRYGVPRRAIRWPVGEITLLQISLIRRHAEQRV